MENDTNIIQEINNAEYVILNINNIWNIHIDKKGKEIFQENHYHINNFNNCKNAINNKYDNIGCLFYSVAQSCLTYAMYNQWKPYIKDVLLNKKTAYKV